MNCRIALAAITCLASTLRATPPRVVSTSPDNGEIDVAAEVSELRVTFDQPMNPGGRSIVGGGPSFPTIAGEPRWIDATTIVVPVTLRPGRAYALSINSDTFKGFAGTNGEPAGWYPIQFRTRAEGAAPAASDVTPAQNRAALDALRKAIDEDYAYRDRRGVDWAGELDTARATLEGAPTANAFARAAARVLRLADDPHISVAAGDVRIGTTANSTPPNFNVALLRKALPQWKQYPGGLASARIGTTGVGYVLFSQCSAGQADDVDAALDELKDTRGLIVDLRANSGGDEQAATRVAAHFVTRPAVYSKDRIRRAGRWDGPFDRAIAPADAGRYAKPVVVLIGPKVMSSAESFALMMRHGAGAALVGERTVGSSGNPKPHPLGSGVTVYLPSWEDQSPDGAILEGIGVRPDVVVLTTPRGLETRDPVIDAAVKRLAVGAAASRP